MPTSPANTTFDYTLEEIRSWGGERQYVEALEQYANKGDVVNPKYANGIGEADITHAGHTIHTRFRTFPGKRHMVENLCPCASSQRDGRICVHMLAAAIGLCQLAHGPRRERAARRPSPGSASVPPVHVRPARAAAPRQPRPVLSPDRPEIGFYVPDDWLERFLSKGAVPLVVSISRGAPRPYCLRDIVARKVAFEPTPEEDDLLFTLEHLFPVSMPEAAKPTLLLDGRKFFDVLDRLGEDRIPLRTVHGEPVVVRPPENALRSSMDVSLDEQSGCLLLSLSTAVPGAPEGAAPRHLVCRDPTDWRKDRVYAALGSALWPIANPIPAAYGDVYFKKTYSLPHRETIDFIRREFHGQGPVVGNMKSLRQILGEDGMRSTVDDSVFTIRPGRPRFTLQVTGSPASLLLSLKATYSGLPAASGPGSEEGGLPITVDTIGSNPSEQFTIADPNDHFLFYARNLPAERRALERLARLGLATRSEAERPEDRVYALPKIVGDDKVLNFFAGTIPSLQRHYWRISLDKGLQAYQKSFVRVAPRITVANIPNANAFDFGYVVSSSDGSVVLTDREYRDAPAGHSFVRQDGRILLFDRDAIETLNGALDECTAVTRGRPRNNRKDGPGAMRRIASTHTHFIKRTLDSLSSSGVTIESAPESWLHEADIDRILSELRPAPLGEPVRSLLRPYQTTGVAWLRYLEAKDQGGILADEMGLGKTIQTLAWLSLPRIRSQGPALVVCPTSLVFNWIHEARHFTPELKVVAMAGSQRHEAFASLADANLVVTSYALIRRDVEEYRKIRFSAVVLDEAQNIKNRNTQNAKSVKRLNRDAARLVVTGTPVENSVADLWSIMDFLMPGYLGHYETFKRTYEEPLLLPAENEAHADAADRLHDKLAPFILRRLKKEVAKELPPKIVKTSWCELSPEQRSVYDRILEESRNQVTGSVRQVGFEKSRMIILTVLLRLRQVCCHLGLLGDENPDPQASRPSGKLEHLFQILDEAMSEGHRVLVFSQFVHMLGILRDELSARKIPFCYLDGASKDRMEQVQRFNTDSSVPVFLISLKAGGAGLNLTGADEVVHFDPWWNPSVEDQATDRAHRIGQKNTVYSLRLITTNTIEERVLQMQRRKRAIIDQIVGGDEQTMAKLTWADVQKLLDIE